MSERIIRYVMGGGMGTRLWPLSLKSKPKQFHPLSLGKDSLLGTTLDRLHLHENENSPLFILAAQEHENHIRQEIGRTNIPDVRAIFEPTSKNTAPAAAIATLHTLHEFGDELILLVPADHKINTKDQFWGAIETSISAALKGNVVLFGTQALYPETAYGYIRTQQGEGNILPIKNFIEKPSIERANGFLKQGNYYWNTGLFLFKADTIRKAFEAFAPEIWKKANDALSKRNKKNKDFSLPIDIYETIPSVSLDKALIQNMTNIVMARADFSWKDLGSWRSLHEIGESDKNGNVLVGDVVAIDCKNTYLRSEGKLLAVSGMSDVVVIATPDATLVTPFNKINTIKNIVQSLDEKENSEISIKKKLERKSIKPVWRDRVYRWLMDEALPLWSVQGVDLDYGGFYEALDFRAQPILKPKRMRTLARQVYSFSVAAMLGWKGPFLNRIHHGVSFIKDKGLLSNGGVVRTLGVDGSVLDATQDPYDHACVFMALGSAYQVGYSKAYDLAQAMIPCIDKQLEEANKKAFHFIGKQKKIIRQQNPYMHFLEAFLLWYDITGQWEYMERAKRIISLFETYFFDPEKGILSEFFGPDWRRLPQEYGDWFDPGHHFEWVSLLVDCMQKNPQWDFQGYAEKLYFFALEKGCNPVTGVCWGAVSAEGIPHDKVSRSWQQAEAIKASIALYQIGFSSLQVEKQMETLLRFHIDPAPSGLWIDQIDEKGLSLGGVVPASVFYHLINAMRAYLTVWDTKELKQTDFVSKRA